MNSQLALERKRMLSVYSLRKMERLERIEKEMKKCAK
jgi:hypothetical protein